MRCVLVGNFGVGNLGDEAICQAYLQRYPSIKWTILSASPKAKNECVRLPGGLFSLFTTPWGKTIRAYRKADAIILGGGSLFTDIESPYACFLWWWHIAVARFFRKPVLLAFQGIGPFTTKKGAYFAKKACKKAFFISVRDQESAKRLENWGYKKFVQTFDPAFPLFYAEKSHKSSKKVFIVIPRQNSGDSFFKALKKHLREKCDQVRIVSIQPDDPEEIRMIAKIDATCHRYGYPVSTHSVRTIPELLKAIEGATVALSHRYHGGLAALAQGIDLHVVSQSAGDKLETLKHLPSRETLKANVEEGHRALESALADLRR